MLPEEEIIYNLISKNATTRKDFVRIVGDVYSRHQLSGYHRNVILHDTYIALLADGKIKENKQIEKLLVTKKMRSLSGVAVITVLTKPYDCPGKCIYCPTEVDVPKSYLSNEPAVMRAILCEYDPTRQVKTRLESLARQGHPIDKIELIVIGGTFSYLPKDYQEEFIKNCFEALNGKKSDNLSAAKKLNEKEKSRCVGLTLETRPDYITAEEVAWFRYLGATRVELGVQSVYDEVLKKNVRGHDVARTVAATKLLKDAGFKICYHMMPNLYGSNLELDKKMFREIFESQDFCPDYIKIYPCMVTAGTILEKLYQKGEYKSYTNEELIELIAEVKKHVPYWVRIMRTIRDIPADNIVSGSKMSNLRQVVLEAAKKEGWQCHCIRCRETGNQNHESRIMNQERCDVLLAEVEAQPLLSSLAANQGSSRYRLFVEKYTASEGTEYFLSYENDDRSVLYSLLRLRLPSTCHSWSQARNLALQELTDCALIREVHTYGQQIEVGEKPARPSDGGDTQHKGLGKKLIVEAEKIAKENGYKKIAVISGVGVRDYYRKLGYELVGEYMVKDMSRA